MEAKYKIKLRSSYTCHIDGREVSGEAGDLVSLPGAYVAKLRELGKADPACGECVTQIVKRLLLALPMLSDRKIAGICDISPAEVNAIRREMLDSGELTRAECEEMDGLVGQGVQRFIWGEYGSPEQRSEPFNSS